MEDVVTQLEQCIAALQIAVDQDPAALTDARALTQSLKWLLGLSLKK